MLVDRTKIKIEMIKRKIKSKDLANKLNLDKSTFSLKINGKRNFSENEIAILYSIFGTTIF